MSSLYSSVVSRQFQPYDSKPGGRTPYHLLKLWGPLHLTSSLAQAPALNPCTSVSPQTSLHHKLFARATCNCFSCFSHVTLGHTLLSDFARSVPWEGHDFFSSNFCSAFKTQTSCHFLSEDFPTSLGSERIYVCLIHLCVKQAWLIIESLYPCHWILGSFWYLQMLFILLPSQDCLPLPAIRCRCSSSLAVYHFKLSWS